MPELRRLLAEHAQRKSADVRLQRLVVTIHDVPRCVTLRIARFNQRREFVIGGGWKILSRHTSPCDNNSLRAHALTHIFEFDIRVQSVMPALAAEA